MESDGALGHGFTHGFAKGQDKEDLRWDSCMDQIGTIRVSGESLQLILRQRLLYLK